MYEDAAWLGERDAHLGPLVRAGLGVLMRSADWDWWHNPTEINSILFKSIPGSGIVVWGGDHKLLEADRWLDESRAFQIARAIQEVLVAVPDLRVKISRDVWKWATFEQLSLLRLDLSKAINNNRLFFEWPIERRPRRPNFPGKDGGMLHISGSHEMKDAGEALSRKLPAARWVDGATIADIFITTIEHYMSNNYVADVVIIVENTSANALRVLDEIRTRGVRCAIRFEADHSELVDWIQDFGLHWNYELIDDALLDVGSDRPARAEVLAANQSFIQQSRRFLDVREKFTLNKADTSVANRLLEDGAQLVLGVHFDPTTTLAAPTKTEPPAARVLEAIVSQTGSRISTFPASGEVLIEVGVQYRSLFTGDRTEFPEHKVKWELDEKRLQVYMLELDRPVRLEEIVLPKKGISTFAKFHYAVNQGQDIDIRFLVSDGVRLVQTARLKGAAGRAIEFSIESATDTLERDKAGFDLALLVNNSLGNRPSATALTKAGIVLKALDGFEVAQIRSELIEAISGAVINPSGNFESIYFELANLGKLLFDWLKHSIPDWPTKLDRIQLTTQADTYFPLEYLYDGELPPNESAGLCPERKACLQAGVAKSPCAIRESCKHLCPMGFLGITATIERQSWIPGMPEYPWLTSPKEFENRQYITTLNRAVFGASAVADQFHDSEVISARVPVRLRDISDELGPIIGNWDEWSESIKSNPSLLVLIPHIEKKKIFIGEDEGMFFSAIRKSHIGLGNPVVIAMGCNSAIGSVAMTGLPSILMRHGAVTVIGALTEILGRYANDVTLHLVKELRQAALASSPTAIADIVSNLRRELLMQDLAMALVIVAFGDADIALGGRAHKANL